VKALLVAGVFPPTIGGPATFVDRLAGWLARRGHAVTVLCAGEGDPAGDAARPFRVARVSLANRYRYELELRARLTGLLASHRHVLVNGLESYLEPIARVLRRRFVLKIVGDALWEGARNRGDTTLDIDRFQRDAGAAERYGELRRRRERLLRLAARVVVPSGYLRSLVAGWGAVAERTVVIPNAAPEILAPARGGAADSALRVAFVGRLTNWKGVDTLLLAVRDLDRVAVDIAGEGPAAPHLLGLADQLGLGDRVRFLGRRSAGEIASLLSAADVLALPSLYEGLSHTVLEAMAHGVPSVASDRGGNPEVIEDGKSGILIPAGSPDALRRALARLRDDRPWRGSLAAGARERARAFPFERSAAAYEALLLESAGG
jgi:glycosyltransferase involved in cell wall biosynthesis